MSTEIKQTAPYAVATLILGICSIVFGCFFVGLICGIIGLVLGGKGKRVYYGSPASYTGYGMLSAGRILSIIGVIFGALYVIYYIIAVVVLGSTGLLALLLDL